MHPDLRTYDVILVNSSAGKDSQAMLDYVVALATAAGVRDRVVVVHCDLGRVEWQGTRALAEEHARHYGLRFEVVRREQGDLLEQVLERGMWPDSQSRYCTSSQKRDQVLPLCTRLANELRLRDDVSQPRILNCIGIRAGESDGREKMQPFVAGSRGSSGRKTIDTWFPIFTWSEETVWARIYQAGTRYHEAYDLGMGRLSCVFCVFATPADLLVAGRHNPELLDEYVAVEARIGHRFKNDLSIAAVRDAIRTGQPLVLATPAKKRRPAACAA